MELFNRAIKDSVEYLAYNAQFLRLKKPDRFFLNRLSVVMIVLVELCEPLMLFKAVPRDYLQSRIIGNGVFLLISTLIYLYIKSDMQNRKTYRPVHIWLYQLDLTFSVLQIAISMLSAFFMAAFANTGNIGNSFVTIPLLGLILIIFTIILAVIFSSRVTRIIARNEFIVSKKAVGLILVFCALPFVCNIISQIIARTDPFYSWQYLIMVLSMSVCVLLVFIVTIGLKVVLFYPFREDGFSTDL